MTRDPRRKGMPRSQPDGPQLLQNWVLKYRRHWQAAYAGIIKQGWATDTILKATPYGDPGDHPPEHFEVHPRTLRGSITRQLTQLRGSFDDPPPEGYFYVFASKSSGRMQGSFVGYLSVAKDTANLPVVVVSVPRGENDKGPDIEIIPLNP